ncbi:MAG TPA: hypothetical protein PKB06_12615 [Actinotalea sp.]|nr:hypothetical protein [Actinotalea sp.]
MMGETADWVALTPRFNSGWPWPEDSYGLDPMYGPRGWCRGCGTPLAEQTGALVVQGRKFPAAEVWMPNWHFDVVCVSARLAAELEEAFEVDLGDVHKPRTGPTGVKQFRPVVAGTDWHRPEDLSRSVVARHREYEGERTGSTCARCGRWKWLPVLESEVPILGASLVADGDVIASGEVFGAGLKAFRHLLFRRRLGEHLVAAEPRLWALTEVTII